MLVTFLSTVFPFLEFFASRCDGSRARWHASTSSAMSWYFQNFCSKTSRSLAERGKQNGDVKKTKKQQETNTTIVYDIFMI